MSTMTRSMLALALAAATAGQAMAQERDPHAGHGNHGSHDGHTGHAAQTDRTGHSSHSDHSDQSGRSTGAGHSGHANHGGRAHHDQPRTPIPPLTDADRAAAFPALSHHGMQHVPERNTYLLFNRFEARDDDEGIGQAWEAQGWMGSDINRLWLRSEGERSAGRTGAADLELLYGRSVSPWWDVVAGVRHDFAPGASQDWLAVGVQGLAPYLFEVSATAYLGESGRSMLKLEAEYELLLTNRWILQPVLEATLHGQDDPARGVGSGLSTVEAGLRLRYEANRHFAPYLGLAHERHYGGTADLHRAEGGSGRETQVVAGIRFWF